MAKAKPLKKPDRPAPRNAQSAAIVDATLTAATELGPSASIEAIAKRAGVGAASVYRYFPNKAALFAEVGRRIHLRMKDEVVALSHTSDFEDGLTRIVRAGIEVNLFSQDIRRHLHEDVPWAWVDETARATTEEIVVAMTDAVERTAAVSVDRATLERRVVVAISTVRGAALSALRFPQLGSTEELLPDVVRTVRACLLGSNV
ncbi:MAG: helix-turn-helix domain-containing protein [Myxococcota bacterium]